jgi:hypothetical protein
MDQAESRLIGYIFINGSVTEVFWKSPPVLHPVRAL